MTHPNQSEREAILAQILGSPEFQDSKRYREFLQYLADKSSGATTLKETEIAQEFFGKDSSFDPATDPFIRSYVSNLRKKLEHYYLTTEDHFAFKLEIPKGHYIVRYAAATPRTKPQRLSRPLGILYPTIIALLLLVIAWMIFRGTEGIRSSDPSRLQAVPSPLWSEFISPNSRPTLIVLGDYFFMRERGDSGAYYRRGKINSLDEYLQYVSKNPEFGKRYVVNSFTYLRPSAPWGLAKILPILERSPAGMSLKLASQFTPDDFRSNNVVFIGSFRTLNVLKNFLHIFKLEYSTTPPSSFTVRDVVGDSAHVFRPERLSAGSLEKDYGVVAKGEGPEGSVILMMLGFSEGGVIQAAQTASDPQFFNVLAEDYPSVAIDSKRLTLVIEAEGMTQSLFGGYVKYVAGIGPPIRTSK